MPIYVTSDWPVSIHRLLAVFRRVRIDEVPYWNAPAYSRGVKQQLTAQALSSINTDISEGCNGLKSKEYVAALPDYTHDPGLTLIEIGGMDVGSRSVYFN
jgi:hypothetical protein